MRTATRIYTGGLVLLAAGMIAFFSAFFLGIRPHPNRVAGPLLLIFALWTVPTGAVVFLIGIIKWAAERARQKSGA